MNKSYNKVSSAAVEKATGKGWDEWVKILDKEDAAKLSHKEIANLLWDKKYIKKQIGWPAEKNFNVGWWCQMVTVGYEYAKGRRIVGETKDAGFEIGVTKTLSISPRKAWKMLFSKDGLKTWLGEVDDFKLQKGFLYKTKNGIEGEVRTIAPGRKIRLTWNKPERKAKPTIVQIYLMPKGKYLSSKDPIEKSKTTSIGFHQEKLKDAKERNKMREYWGKILGELEEILK